jgi:hypothetical protein
MAVRWILNVLEAIPLTPWWVHARRQRNRRRDAGTSAAITRRVSNVPSLELLAKRNVPEMSDFPQDQSRTVFGRTGARRATAYGHVTRSGRAF